MPFRSLSFPLVAGVALACVARCALSGAAQSDPAPDYAPDAEIEQTIQQLTLPDKLGAQNAWERLAGLGGAAERALQWHLFRERDLSAKVRWAEFLSRLGRGKVGYRVTVELQPDGSGLLSLWSDRVLLAECAKRFDRLQGKRERSFSEEELRRNVYSKVELFDCLNDGVKPQEARVESRDDAVEAYGLLSFKNFDALAAFAEKLDTGGYYMLGGTTLADSANAIRTYRFRKAREGLREQHERNMLLFYNVQWEFVLDFKGAIRNSNAPKTDGSRLVWTFNCLQMVSGQVLIEASFDAKGLAPRPQAREDRALPVPAVAQANQPIAIVRQDTVRARAYKGAPGEKLVYKTLRERGELVELDGRDSMPKGPDLQYHWTQTYGADLDISAADLAKDRLCLIVKQPGEYRFELVTSASGIYSKPVEVKVTVEDDRPAAAAAAGSGGKRPEPGSQTESAAPKATAQTPPGTTPGDEQKTQTPALAATPPKPDPAKAKELHAQAVQLMKCFKYTDARKLLHEAVALDPANRACQFDLGVALMECGELPAAITRFEDIAVSKNDAHAWMNIGHCHSRAGDLAGAGQWYRRGAEIAGGKVMWEPHWQLANNALAKKDFKGALELLERVEKDAAAAKVQDCRLLRDLARALHGCKRDEEAMQRLVALQEMGYTPEPQFVAEVRQAAEASRAAKAVASAGAEAAQAPGQKTEDKGQKVETKDQKPVEPPPATVATKTSDQKPEPATQKPEAKKPVESPPATVATKTGDQKPEPATQKPEAKKPVEPPPATVATKTGDQKPEPATQKPEAKKPGEPPPATVATKTGEQKPEPATQ
ncbi:MAG: tetratricopeptide repeat protein [Planctomycetota bacterium]|nr:tetratricopeptide repeat protein [Planctomycetota bacterium]